MTNSFMNALKNDANFTYTENGAVTHKTTKSDVYDMFALGGAYRNRTDEDVILLFKNALDENETLALKCLFYLRDCRGGQGERRFFRVAYHWLAQKYPKTACRNLIQISAYGRWDDLIYVCLGTPLEREALTIIKKQFELDLQCQTPSLLGKWMPSENASSHTTKHAATVVRKFLGLTPKAYRKDLALLRSRINIVEKLMSENRWNEIQFDKLPSRAGFIYRNAFARRDLIAKKYENFAKSETTKVNADVLYPYEIAHRAFSIGYNISVDYTERLMLQKYWDNLPNYYGDHKENGLAIVDTSGSMWGQPLDVAVSLGAYVAEKAHGPFANYFITFSDDPQLVRFEGVDIVDKFKRAKSADWGGFTNIEAVFDMLLKTAQRRNVRISDMPTRLYIFSDMEFNACMTGNFRYWEDGVLRSEDEVETLLEGITKKWAAAGYELPHVIFWNLDARQNNIPAMGGRFSYVSGFSPVMIQTILGGKDGYDLMLEKLNSERYAAIR